MTDCTQAMYASTETNEVRLSANSAPAYTPRYSSYINILSTYYRRFGCFTSIICAPVFSNVFPRLQFIFS